jgi:hypothetical protein
MARLLADAKKRVQDGLEPDYQLNERIEAEILPKLAEERKASPLIEKVRRLRKEGKEAEKALGKLGFDMSDYDDTLSLAEKAPKELHEALEKARHAARKERDAELLRYDKAILRVWAAEDAGEAKRIVEELL